MIDGVAVRPGRGARALFAVVLAVQLVVLYWPRAVQPPSGGLPWDKLVHALVFGAVYWAGVRAGVPWRAWLAVSLAHAPVSELLQHAVLPNRRGDAGDAIADAAGVLLAWALTAYLTRRAGDGPRHPADGARVARE